MKKLTRCKKCGYCCTPNFFHDRIDIQPSDIEKWKKLKIWKKIRRYLERTDFNETGFIISLDEKSCPFLDADNLCKIHKEYGHNAKPLECKKFNCSMLRETKRGEKDENQM